MPIKTSAFFQKKIWSANRLVIVSWLIFVVNALLRLWFLDGNAIAHDEPFSIFHAQLDTGLIIHELSLGNNPPLFELILHYWISWFGISAFAVRFLSALFSCISAVVIFRLGLRWADFGTGVLATAFFTFSTYQMQYSHEARSYSLLCMLSLFSFYFFIRIIKQQSTWSLVWVWSIIHILLGYTHYFGIAVILLQVGLILLRGLKNRTLLYKAATMIFIFLLAYTPWVAVLWQRFADAGGNGTWLRAASVEDLYNALWSFSNSPVCTVFFGLLLMVFAVYYLLKKLRLDSGTYAIVCWFFVPLLAMFLISWEHSPIRIPMFLDRYMIYFSPAYYLLMAYAAVRLSDHWKMSKSWLLVPVVVFLDGFKINPDNKRDSASVVEWVRAHKTPDTAVLITPADFRLNFCYYYNPIYFSTWRRDNIYADMDSLLAAEHIYIAESDHYSEEWKIGSSPLILIDAGSDFTWKDQYLKQALQAKFKQMESIKFRSIFEVSILQPLDKE